MLVTINIAYNYQPISERYSMTKEKETMNLFNSLPAKEQLDLIRQAKALNAQISVNLNALTQQIKNPAIVKHTTSSN